MASPQSFWDNSPPYLKTMLLMLLPALLVFVLEEATRLHAASQPVAVAPEQVSYSFTPKDLETVKKSSVDARSLLQAIDQNLSATHPAAEFVCLNGLRYGVYSPLSATLTRINDSMGASLAMRSNADEQLMSANTLKLINYLIGAIPTMNMVITSMSQGCNGNTLVLVHTKQIQTFVQQNATALKAIQSRVQSPQK